jgi:hypothetical protein
MPMKDKEEGTEGRVPNQIMMEVELLVKRKGKKHEWDRKSSDSAIREFQPG